MIAALLGRWGWPLALLAVAMLVGVQSMRLASEKRAHAETRAAFAQAQEAATRAALDASNSYRAIEQRRQADLKEISHEAQEQVASAHADAAAARDAGERLRAQLARIATASRCPSGNPAPSQGGETAEDPVGVLANVLSRADERAGKLAEYADAARIAGLACEAAYESLTP